MPRWTDENAPLFNYNMPLQLTQRDEVNVDTEKCEPAPCPCFPPSKPPLPCPCTAC